ncbi:hypothetical protein [Streptomyces sp. NPDC058157]|uniref:hypothetical protein n=1 Tax=Streptomyces sp. NPDC058157 TaxID=3346360 RepID=UPI0036EDE9CC
MTTTELRLNSAEDVAFLEVVRPAEDCRAVRMVAAGRCSPLATLESVAPGGERVLLAGVARIEGVGRAAVVNWRRRPDDCPAPVAGTDVHPQFEARASSPGSGPTTRSAFLWGRRSPT